MRKFKAYLIAAVLFIATPTMSARAAEQKAVFAGGCFWGVEAVFEHVKGVTAVRSGYAGGTKGTANYEGVSSGATKHAEAVEIRFDPAKVTYEQLLNVFFVVAHDPTQIDRQGPDTGTQYRSAIFYSDEQQKKSAMAFIKALNESKAFGKPIATEVVPLTGFFEAEEHHQNYLKLNPEDPYIVYNDLPKVADLKKKFPALYRTVPAP
ncbi:MAG TPA: peptide-methionine (S)-S-oxide reductase MsrA [Pyrinomonadaceae bacterium]|nr:peptide-methionine (S)-S-oxide reductase MsrA [Pyrinomonadaceae bacterium]